MAPDAGLGARALADLNRVAERAREQLPGGALGLGRLPRLAHLAEDLALADDHRVETGRDAEQMRDRGVVVVRVQTLREVVGVEARLLGEEVAHVVDAVVEARRARVDLGAVARGEQHQLGEVLSGCERRAAPSGRPEGATVMRSSRSTAAVRWFSPTTTRDTPAEAPSLRPSGRRGSDRACRNRGHVANSAPLLERPAARSCSRASESRSSRTAHSGPISDCTWSLRYVASAGLRPPVPIATTRSPWRTTDMSVNEQLAGSSAALTQIRRASPAAKTSAFTAGSSVAAVASHAPSRSSAVKARSSRVSRPSSCHARTSSSTCEATTCTVAPAASSASILRAAIRPAPTTTHRRPSDQEVHRVPEQPAPGACGAGPLVLASGSPAHHHTLAGTRCCW